MLILIFSLVCFWSMIGFILYDSWNLCSSTSNVYQRIFMQMICGPITWIIGFYEFLGRLK